MLQFAITLYYYSPAAYNYVCRQLKSCLVLVLSADGCLHSIVSEMTYTVSSGTLNSSIPYHTIVFIRWKPRCDWAVVWNDCQKVNGNDKNGHINCVCYSAHMDEMELKKQLEVDRTTGKLYGFRHWLRLALQHCVHWFFKPSGTWLNLN